jgi:hypothetical protein
MSDDQPSPENEPPSGETPIQSSIMSWSDVYRVKSCGKCGKSDCPTCTKKFLQYLNHQGQQPKGMGPR